MRIQELSISARTKGCLLTAGYEELEDLKDITDEELLKIRNLNAKGVAEIREKIEEYFAEEDFIDCEDLYEDEFEDIIEDGEDYLDSRDISLDELEFSVRTYNCLKRAGILSLGDICEKTMEDMTYVRNLGRKGLEEVIDKLNELGLSLNEHDNLLNFMASYPENIKDIARKKEEAWEYQLFIEAAIFKYEKLREYRNQTVVFWKSKHCLIQIDSTDSFVNFINAEMDKVGEFSQRIAICMSQDIKEAFGEQGKPGSEKKIIESAEKMMQIYEDMISWKISLEDIDADYIYRSVIEQFCPVIDSVLNNMDVFYSKLMVAKKQFEDLRAGRLTLGELQIDLSLSFELQADNLIKALDEWNI